MKIIIQCAGGKKEFAGYMKDSDGNTVKFVAHPELSEPEDNVIFAKPDDIANDGVSWRKHLIAYNKQGENPLSLLPAHQLYCRKEYTELVEKFGIENVYILSAGWGLVKASYLLPKYDITFSKQASKDKRRSKSDTYDDFKHLCLESNDKLIFLGGADYLGLFNKLTTSYSGQRIVFYKSSKQKEIPNCKLVYFDTTAKTNWHYLCAQKIINGSITIGNI